MKKIILLIILTIISGAFMCFSNTKAEESKQCTKENVYQSIKKSGIEFTDIVFAQIILESGELKSKLTRCNNNFLGMKMPEKRETTAIGKSHGYALYAGWEDCVQDYLLYQNYTFRKKKMTRNQYLSFIGKSYSECGTYKNRILRVIKENREFIKMQDSLYYCYTL
jgi:uncharacterized FlgJ-related protein